MKKLLAAILACSMVASVGVSTIVSAAVDTYDSSVVNIKEIIRSDDDDASFYKSTDVVPATTYYVGLHDLGEMQEWNDIVDAVPSLVDGEPIGSAGYARIDNANDFKVSLKKGSNNSKMIKKMSVVTKKVYGARTECLKIEFAEEYTDKEYKVTPEIIFTGKKNTKDVPNRNCSDLKFIAEMPLYVSNVNTGDTDFEVGTGGLIMKPLKGEDNTVTWNDNGRDVAKLTFIGDSDVVKIFPKLSTRWDNSDYFEYFNDQDAFIFEFVGGSTVSSTSRALLEIYNPYLNEDDELTVSIEDVVIYKVSDGELIDDTDNWTLGTNDDGEEVISTKTRVLGTYIIAEHEADVGYDDDDTTDPSGDPVAPGVKPNPPTGR